MYLQYYQVAEAIGCILRTTERMAWAGGGGGLVRSATAAWLESTASRQATESGVERAVKME